LLELHIETLNFILELLGVKMRLLQLVVLLRFFGLVLLDLAEQSVAVSAHNCVLFLQGTHLLAE